MRGELKTSGMTKYPSRVVDGELRKRLSVTGAVLIDGPKAVGKTFTASRVAKTALGVATDHAVRAALGMQPEQPFTYRTPTCSTNGRGPRSFGTWFAVPLMTTTRRACTS